MTRGLSLIQGLLVVGGIAQASFEASMPSAAEVALANGQVAWAPEGGALELNPALVGLDSGWTAGAGITHPLGISDLNLSGVWVGRGVGHFAPAWRLRWKQLQAGELYREDLLSLDVGTGNQNWLMGGGWRAGRSIFSEGKSTWIQGYALGAEIRFPAFLSMGAAFEDLAGLESPDPRFAQPWFMRWGLAASPVDSLWASAISLEKRQNQLLCWKFGQEVRWKILRFRAGVRMQPWVLSYGAGVRWEGLGIDWAQEGDSRLGWQQHWTISVMM